METHILVEIVAGAGLLMFGIVIGLYLAPDDEVEEDDAAD